MLVKRGLTVCPCAIFEIKEHGKDAYYIKKIKRLYTSCSNTELLDRQGGELVVDRIKRHWNWPISQGKNWSKLSFDWRDTLIDFRAQGYSHDILFNLSVTENPLNTSAYIIKLDRPSFALNYSNIRSYLTPGTSEYYKDPRSSYRLFIDRVIGYYEQEYRNYYHNQSLNFSKSELTKDLTDMINFEVMLANISLRYENSTYEKYTIWKLIVELPEVHWVSYINTILQNDLKRVQVDENEPIIINSLDFLKEVINLIEITDERTVANYMIWRVIHQSLPLLTCHARILDYKKDSLMWWEPPFQYNCYKANQDRWKFCISVLSRTMRMAVRSYYMQHYLTEESRKAVRAVRFHVAYRRELLNDSYINDLYKNLVFKKKDNYSTNVLKLRKWLTDKSLSLLRSPNKTEKPMKRGYQRENQKQSRCRYLTSRRISYFG
ncbi:Metalloendopeptidase-like protein PEX, partial [Stegodyphus mimosarum]